MTARNDAIIVFPVISLRLLSNTPQRNHFFASAWAPVHPCFHTNADLPTLPLGE
jgi:hypothetical protein